MRDTGKDTAGVISEHVLTKTLRDGKTELEFRIEPDPGRGEDPGTCLGYWLVTYWDGKRGGTFHASPQEVAEPPAPGITHAISAVAAGGSKWVTVGLTAAEAATITAAEENWSKARKDRLAAERAAREAALRAAVPGATTWKIPDPHGYLTALGGTVRDTDGRAVTALGFSKTYYSEDGMCFGAADDRGYVYFTEVREATPGEEARLRDRESRQARRDALQQEASGLWRSPDAEIPEEPGDLGTLPSARTEPRRRLTGAVDPFMHLRIDEPGGWLWVLRYNGADGDDWSLSNYRASIAWRLPLTPERAALAADLVAEFGRVDG